MKSKTFGGVLLVIGTTIGGAMLALPAATGPAGFFPAAIMLIVCWILMTFCAFLILEANLWLPQNSNIISMARATLGGAGEIIAWITYLLLLYSLVAAYVATGSNIFNGFLNYLIPGIPHFVSALIFLAIFGSIIYQGIHLVDMVTRGFMLLKLISYLVIVLFALSYIHLKHFDYIAPKFLLSTVTIVITSFGFATIIPSLRVYFKDDISKLRFIILTGSIISLICYLVWIFVVLGTLPVHGFNGLIAILHSNDSAASLVTALRNHLQKNMITTSAHIFTSISVVTSFLGVSLCLSDFLADGFNITKKGWGTVKIFVLTFVPPMLIALFYPRAFIVCLNYAGILCIILLVSLPSLMVWRGRYTKQFTGKYQVIGGKPAVLFAFLLGFVVIGVDIIFGSFH